MNEQLLGNFRVKVKRGINLPAPKTPKSNVPFCLDSYVVGYSLQRIDNCYNTVWDEEFTLSITNPNQIVKIEVYDKDILKDVRIGDAYFTITHLYNATKNISSSIRYSLTTTTTTTVTTITTTTTTTTTANNNTNLPLAVVVKPGRDNCLAEDSHIVCELVQNMFLRLNNQEEDDESAGEIELELRWTVGVLPPPGAPITE